MTQFNWTRVDVNAPSDRSDFIRQWVLKLFDPTLKQGKNRLKTTDNEYCCIGVGSELIGLKQEARGFIFMFGDDDHNSVTGFTKPVTEFLHCKPAMSVLNLFGQEKQYDGVIIAAQKYLGSFNCLADANDQGKTFFKIANTIRLFPRAFFRNLTDEENDYIVATKSPTWKAYQAAKKDLKESKGDSNGEGLQT